LRAGYQQKQNVNTVVCAFLVTFTSRVVDIVGHNKMTNWVAAKVHARVQNIHSPSKQETTEQCSFHLVLHFEECSRGVKCELCEFNLFGELHGTFSILAVASLNLS
jgi:hypothetical protein